MPRLRPIKAEQPKPVIQTGTELFEAPDPEQKIDKEDTDGEPEVVVAAESKNEAEAAAELKKQIEALKRSEAEQRQLREQAEQERQQARQEAMARAAEIERFKGEINESRATVFDTGIAKETEAVEAAKRDLGAAHSSGDSEALITAYERLAEAKARLETLKNGKAAIEAEIKEAKSRTETKQTQPQDPLDKLNLPDIAKRWLRAHPEYLTDNRKNAKIQALHFDIIDEGHAPYSEAYFNSMETHLGMRKPPEKKEDNENEEERSSIVSAPVIREAPGSGGQRGSGVIKLTPAQREAAKMAGITETEYAKQLIKLRQEKDAGNYGEGR